jgi:uncharacterized protein (DUF2236 family)
LINPFESWRRIVVGAFSNGEYAPQQWSLDLAKGDDQGYFLPGSAVWAVHGSDSTIIAGVRALLMQSLHPGVLAGVVDHSGFRDNPLARLANTIRWIFTVTYGSTTAAERACQRVQRIHESIHGGYRDGHGRDASYSAKDPELVRWVHITFTDAFLAAHKIWGGPIPGGPDAYVREWARAGQLMGVTDPPLTEAQLRQQLDSYYQRGELRADERVAETAAFLRRPPLHPTLRLGYRLIFAGAVESLEPKYRDMMGLRAARLGPFPLPAKFAGKVTLAVVRLALGPVSPSQQAARERLRRLGYPA